MLLLDLDNFGAINKSAGHAAGDTALRRVVEHLARVAADTGIVGRLGGDEFAVILTGAVPEQVARRILADIIAKPESGPALGASIGMAQFPRDGEDAESLLRAVDVALRVAKRTGISQLSVYAGDPIAGRGHGGAHDALERLISGEGLEMAVQPIVVRARGHRPRLRGAGSLPPGLELATRCTGSPWPTSSRCATGSSSPACGPA